MYQYIVTSILFNSITICMMYLTNNNDIFIFFLVYILTMYSIMLGMHLLEKSLYAVNYYLSTMFITDDEPKTKQKLNEKQNFADDLINVIKLSIYTGSQWIYIWLRLWISMFGLCLLSMRFVIQLILCCVMYPIIICYDYIYPPWFFYLTNSTFEKYSGFKTPEYPSLSCNVGSPGDKITPLVETKNFIPSLIAFSTLM